MDGKQDLLTADEVAAYLDVGPVTVYRWCREGRLPCMKIGKVWRIRRAALEDFLRQHEQSRTLAGQLNRFITVPDHLLAIAATPALLHRLDAAFFQVGETHDGLLVKSYRGETESPDQLRATFRQYGLDVPRLEAAGRFHFTRDVDPRTERAEVLRRLLATPEAQGRSLWISFDWAQDVTLQEALRQQDTLAALVETQTVVVKTAILEETLEAWPFTDQRSTQTLHRGTIWITPTSITLSRVTLLPTA